MRKIIIPVLCSFIFVFAGCSNQAESNQGEAAPVEDTAATTEESVMNEEAVESSEELVYICPCGGCPEIRESEPGTCSKCDMDLVAETK